MRRAHLIGASGGGMQALATVLLGQGWALTGSDLCGGTMHPAEGRTIAVRRGHGPNNLPTDADAVVYSDAVNRRNPELQRARKLGIPTLSYFEMVAKLTAPLQCVAIAGTHGKSSTVGMCRQIFHRAGHDPMVLCGAATIGQPSGGRHGAGRCALVEACEFRANFLRLRPRMAAVLGIEHDHFDCYPVKQQLLDAFTRFVQSVPPNGLLIVPADCVESRRLAERASCRVETFSLSGEADWSAGRLVHRRGFYQFEARYRGHPVCDVGLQVLGAHNARNALATTALAWANDISSDDIAKGLHQFPGLKRRLECLGTFDGVTIIDDYAHHPTEVAAALKAVQQRYPGRRLWCLFQPHQAVRLTRLLHETALALQGADVVVITEVFRAREGNRRRGEADADALAREVRKHGVPASAAGPIQNLLPLVATRLTPGDVLITMGAGDIHLLPHTLAKHLPQNAPMLPAPASMR